MREAEADNLIYHPLQNPITLPPMREGYGQILQEGYITIKKEWEEGKLAFLNQWADEEKGQSLRQFPWRIPEHQLTLRQVLNKIIGLHDQLDRNHGLYRSLRDTRRILNLGRLHFIQDGIYDFTSEEIAQLIVGFYAYI